MNAYSLLRIMGVVSLFSCTLFAPVYSQEKPRVYKHDFEGQDLTDKDMSKQNWDDANFEDAVLKNTNLDGASLKNCNFQGAKLEGTSLRNADLTGSDFRKATIYYPSLSGSIFNNTDFSGVDLKGTSTHEMKFREAKLRGTKGFNQIYGTDYFKADLRGADLSTAVLLDRTNFRKAKYDQYTRWPKGFSINDQGMEFVESKPDDKTADKPSQSKSGNRNEAGFQKLDRNEDGVLSGVEMKGLDELDANGDGEISLSEFVVKGND